MKKGILLAIKLGVLILIVPMWFVACNPAQPNPDPCNQLLYNNETSKVPEKVRVECSSFFGEKMIFRTQKEWDEVFKKGQQVFGTSCNPPLIDFNNKSVLRFAFNRSLIGDNNIIRRVTFWHSEKRVVYSISLVPCEQSTFFSIPNPARQEELDQAEVGNLVVVEKIPSDYKVEFVFVK